MHYTEWWKHFLAGGVAGAVSRTCTAPLDRLKVFYQVKGNEYNGYIACLRNMIQEGGMISLWRGNGFNVMKTTPESAIRFMAYEEMKLLIHGNTKRDLNIYERFISGSIAGGISQTVMYPMEMLKTRLILRKTNQYKNILDAVERIASTEGIYSFYRGYVPNLIGVIHYAGIDLAIYETSRKLFLSYTKDENPGVLVPLISGTISSSCGQLVCYPLALVKTRLQANISKEKAMIEMFRTIIAKEGFTGLYRGIIPNFIKVCPAVSISYFVYETTKRSLNKL